VLPQGLKRGQFFLWPCALWAMLHVCHRSVQPRSRFRRLDSARYDGFAAAAARRSAISAREADTPALTEVDGAEGTGRLPAADPQPSDSFPWTDNATCVTGAGVDADAVNGSYPESPMICATAFPSTSSRLAPEESARHLDLEHRRNADKNDRSG